ncbi:unnamed protein product [Dovyalis caffra]|uniref:Uncharacterized protein n=1 Tax=Dovyalis caffra TaxID=77055 RepID=A0AAV1S253_9ROSI|nr:unnamed protein product [Dovyalis caffra]
MKVIGVFIFLTGYCCESENSWWLRIRQARDCNMAKLGNLGFWDGFSLIKRGMKGIWLVPLCVLVVKLALNQFFICHGTEDQFDAGQSQFDIYTGNPNNKAGGRLTLMGPLLAILEELETTMPATTHGWHDWEARLLVDVGCGSCKATTLEDVER